MNKSFFWLYLLALVVLSLMPVDRLPDQLFDIWDKAQHALGFVVLTLLALRAYPQQRQGRTALALLGLGGLVELAQAATGWRMGDGADLLANAVGISLALASWHGWRRLRGTIAR